MENSIQRVRSQFDAKPLFHDEALSHELQVYENRQRAVEVQKRADAAREHTERLVAMSRVSKRNVSQHGVPDAQAEGDPLLPYRASGIHASATSRSVPASVVPPPVPRPWSVERLLNIGVGVERSAAIPQRGGTQAPRADHEDEAVRHAALHQSLPEDPYWEGVANDRQLRKRWKKESLASHKNRGLGDGSDDEHDYRFNGAYYASQGNLRAPVHGAQRRANLTDASSLRAYDRDEMVLLNGEDSDRGSSIFEFEPSKEPAIKSTKGGKELAPSLMEAHIERAAARKALQENRLRALGVRAPNARVEMGTQANTLAGEDLSSILGASHSPKKIAPSTAQFEGDAQNDISRHVTSQNQGDARAQLLPREGLVLEPQLPLRARRFEPVTSTNTDTVWQRVLNEEKRIAAAKEREVIGDFLAAPKEAPYGVTLGHSVFAPKTADGYKMPDVPNSWLDIVQSTANTEGFRPPSMRMGPGPAQQPPAQSSGWPQPPQATSAAEHMPPSNRGDILRRIDQMQLANEEMLIRNKVIKDPLPSSAGGAFSFNTTSGRLEQNPEERMTRDAIAHVATAHGDPSANEAALRKFRPIGGYGSVTEPGYKPVDSEQERWAAARYDNERRQMHSADAEPLRAWATGLPTNYIGSLVDTGPSITTVKPGAAGRGGVENAARRKWGDVTFSAPNQHAVAPGVVENLSSKARAAMFPDAAFN